MSVIALKSTQASNAIADILRSTVAGYQDYLDQNIDSTPNHLNPLAQAYIALQSNNEVYTLKQMLQQPDREQFVAAMQKEVESMFSEGIWKRTSKQEMLNHYRTLKEQDIDARRLHIMMTWSFKRKRNPDGSLNKHKARLCCHGGQQQWGVNFWDTYAPVVSWSSIRILMTLVDLHGLHTKFIDFVHAYP